MTEQDMKQILFGPEITRESMIKKPLGRMLQDLEREYLVLCSSAVK